MIKTNITLLQLTAIFADLQLLIIRKKYPKLFDDLIPLNIFFFLESFSRVNT